MTLEKYVETTPKGFYLMIYRGYDGPGERKVSLQDLMADEKKWDLYKKMLVGAVDSIEPPDGYDQARLLTIERGFDLWCKDSM